MTAKKFRDLTYNDLGKHVELIEVNGDKSTGVLKSLHLAKSSVMAWIDNTTHSGLDPDQEIIFVKGE